MGTPDSQGYGDKPEKGPVQQGHGMMHGPILRPVLAADNPGKIQTEPVPLCRHCYSLT
jgi:hypothetical protein